MLAHAESRLVPDPDTLAPTSSTPTATWWSRSPGVAGNRSADATAVRFQANAQGVADQSLSLNHPKDPTRACSTDSVEPSDHPAARIGTTECGPAVGGVRIAGILIHKTKIIFSIFGSNIHM